MARPTRVLLLEHLGAVGSAPIDVRHHATALRSAGAEVECLALDGAEPDQLSLASGGTEPGRGGSMRDDAAGRAELRARVAASRAELVLWASASPGGGGAAREVLSGLGRAAAWWPTGLAAATGEAGPLAALAPELSPLEGSAVRLEELRRPRLPLWDGPYALAPAPLARETAASVIGEFARAAAGRDEVDLVVLDAPDAGLESIARRAGVAQRVHFVGRAPREAEMAWLGTAAIALVAGEAPLSGGLALRALGAGCPLVAVGEGAAPLAAWLRAKGLGWAGGSLAEAIEAALEGEPPVSAAIARGRAVAEGYGLEALSARLAAALRAREARGRRAA